MKRLIQACVLAAVCFGLLPSAGEAYNQQHNYGGCSTWCCFAQPPHNWCWTEQNLLIPCAEYTGPRYCSTAD